MEELAPGLRRWTAHHPDWDEQVASAAVETEDGLVVIDPLAPPPELEADHVLLTVYWHARSTPQLGRARVWAPARSATPLRNRGIEVTDAVRGGDALPGGIEAIQTARAAELVFRLPRQRAVVVGDVLLGAGAKPHATRDPLRLCPEGWLGKRTHDDLRASLRPLLDVPPELVLVSHGEPVLRGARRALERALAPHGER
ncbi:MAG: hypothetical protein ICV64_01850 [Thermoleophilia bacterium]|nr:hypothetical protein [Thermoleophilia bacterium]